MSVDKSRKHVTSSAINLQVRLDTGLPFKHVDNHVVLNNYGTFTNHLSGYRVQNITIDDVDNHMTLLQIRIQPPDLGLLIAG
jgi:hypothetical protein